MRGVRSLLVHAADAFLSLCCCIIHWPRHATRTGVDQKVEVLAQPEILIPASCLCHPPHLPRGGGEGGGGEGGSGWAGPEEVNAAYFEKKSRFFIVKQRLKKCKCAPHKLKEKEKKRQSGDRLNLIRTTIPIVLFNVSFLTSDSPPTGTKRR